MSVPAIRGDGSVRRRLIFDPPLDAPPDAVLEAVAARLRQAGSRILRQTGDQLEFTAVDGFVLFDGSRKLAATVFEAGSLAVAPGAPVHEIQLTLRYNPMSWVWAFLLAGCVVLLPIEPVPRGLFLVAGAGMAALNLWLARTYYQREIFLAARQARGSAST